MIKSEFSCPTCKKTTGRLNQIIANAGYLQCSVDQSHRWNDTAMFLAERPTMDFKVEVPTNLPQENHAPLTVSVPIKLKEHLEKNYGNQLSPTVVAVLSQLSQNAIIVSDVDLDRLRTHLGQAPKNSSDLVGLVYAKVAEVDDVKAERDTAVSDLKAYESISPGRVVIDMGDQAAAIREKAKDANLPVKVWVEKTFLDAVRNNWF